MTYWNYLPSEHYNQFLKWTFLKATEQESNGLRVLGDQPYEIDLDPEAKPHAIFTPWRVPYPIRGKVKAELTCMESLGVISKVEQATPWCAEVVVVPKKTSSVHAHLCGP